MSEEPRRAIATVKIGPKGQIVIPKEMREMFGLTPDTTVVILADSERGIAIQTMDRIEPFLKGLV